MKKRLAFCVAAFALFASVACAAVNEAGLAKLEEVLKACLAPISIEVEPEPEPQAPHPPPASSKPAPR